MLFIVLFKAKNKISQISKNYKLLIPIGLFIALTMITQMIAINMALVAYVIAIKRTSIILSVIFGFLIFKEKGIKERLIGTIIMVLGAILIMLF
jgi:uncharacterized membrane protein